VLAVRVVAYEKESGAPAFARHKTARQRYNLTPFRRTRGGRRTARRATVKVFHECSRSVLPALCRPGARQCPLPVSHVKVAHERGRTVQTGNVQTNGRLCVFASAFVKRVQVPAFARCLRSSVRGLCTHGGRGVRPARGVTLSHGMFVTV